MKRFCSYRDIIQRQSYDNPLKKRIFVTGSATVALSVTIIASYFFIATTMTIEDAKKYMSGLQDNSHPELWESFLHEDEIRSILKTWLRASCLGADYTVDDLAHAIYLYSITKHNLVPTELEKDIEDENGRKKASNESSCLPGYFKVTVKRLLWNPSFLRSSFGVVLHIDLGKARLDETPQNGGAMLSERLPARREQEMAEAKEDVETFKLIIKLVEEKYPRKPYGELLRRYYLPPREEARIIAIDFLRKGLIRVGDRLFGENDILTEPIIKAATDNIQNRKLPYARDKFNEIALSYKIDLRLSGKIKKSIIKDI